MRRWLLFILVITKTLFSEEISSPIEMAALQSTPEALVFDCINAMTGDLIFQQEDIVIKGAFPLSFPRRYISREVENPNLRWDPTSHFGASGYSFGLDAYTPRGNIETILENGLLKKYRYDPLDQLIEEPTHQYTYDSLHNRLSKDEDLHEINSLNQLEKTAANIYFYDKNGNLIQKNGINYHYDALDRLIRVETPQTKIIYTYDSEHRRLTKNDTPYLWDGQHELGTSQIYRILGNTPHAEIGSAIAIFMDDLPYLPIHDLFGNLIGLATLTQEILETQTYTSFGEGRPPQNLPWGYFSKSYEPETNLIYFGRRFYDPELGRFITSDPEGYTDSLNLYAFVLNNPLIHKDPYGLSFLPLYFPGYPEPNYEDYKQASIGFTHGLGQALVNNVLDWGKYGGGIHGPDDWSFLDTYNLSMETNNQWRQNASQWFQSSLGADPTHSSYNASYITTDFASDLAIGTMLPFNGKFGRTAFSASRVIPEASSVLKATKLQKLLFQANKAKSVPKVVSENKGVLNAGQIWTRGKWKKNAKNAYEHWIDHGKDFPELLNANQYVKFAHDFIKNPPAGTLMKFRNNMEQVLYNPQKNIFGTYKKNKVPKTIYKPDPSKHPFRTNLEYFYDR